LSAATVVKTVAHVGALIAAWLRGEDAYRGNHLEEGAYDATRRL
jgi:hypothetical protein